MSPIQARIVAKCAEVVRLAREKYNIDISDVPVQFNLRGHVAGWASWKIDRFTGHTYNHLVRLNSELLLRGDQAVLDEMIDDTLPHEFAHIVCAMNPALGKNHDYGWYMVCTALGGTGDRTHDMKSVFAHGNTYEYTTTTGQTVRLKESKHVEVQAGKELRYRQKYGFVNRYCRYMIVGSNGRALQTPVAPNTAQALHVQPAAVQTPAVTPVVPRAVTPAPVARVAVAAAMPGESKASISRRIMSEGYRIGHTYEAIIAAMIAANGYDRQLARGTFKANAPKVGIPSSFYL